MAEAKVGINSKHNTCKKCSDVEVRMIGGSKGKGLFARKRLQAGQVIFQEKPLVSCQFLWNATYGYLCCDFCMKPLETAEENARRLTALPSLTLPYPQCCVTNKESIVTCFYCPVSYCNEECRQYAWNQYHATLCQKSFETDPNHPLEQLQDVWRHMHYPPETTNIMLIARMIATVKQAKDKDDVVRLFDQFCQNTVNEEEEIAHKLLGEQFQSQLETLRQLMIKAVYEDTVQQWYSPAGFRSLIALVGLNGQGIGTSPLSIWVKNCENLDLATEQRETLDDFIDNLYTDLEKESGSFLNNEGSALYSLQSSCNHSCIPNAQPCFIDNNFNLVMMALRDIEPDEEIFVSYLDECSRNRSRHSRIKLLRENYLFTCICEKCQEQIQDDDVTSSDEDDDDENSENGNDCKMEVLIENI